MSGATLSRWSRGFVAAGVVFLVVWQTAVLAGLPRRTTVTLGLYGFVLHVVFGKAYSLVPSYFDRDIALPRSPSVHLPLSILGVTGLSIAPLDGIPRWVEGAGAGAWALGVAIFLVAILATIRDNLTGSETGTGDHNADRRPVDRVANLFLPAVLAYLGVGSWDTLARATRLPTVVGAYPPRTTHLLAGGTATLLVFVVGFRLLPRFLVAAMPRAFPWVVLPAGAVGPLVLAVTLPAGTGFQVGAGIESVAIVGFAGAYGLLWYRTDRDRVGFYGPLVGVLSGVVGVGLGLSFAFGPITGDLILAHYRANVLGFLGLTIVGVTYQFYPPTVGRFPGAGDRLAVATIAGLGGGLVVEVVGLVGASDAVVAAGRMLGLVAALGYAYLVLGVFLQRLRS
jgi:hypothetical protein